jgi:hypothetical protein
MNFFFRSNRERECHSWLSLLAEPDHPTTRMIIHWRREKLYSFIEK